MSYRENSAYDERPQVSTGRKWLKGIAYAGLGLFGAGVVSAVDSYTTVKPRTLVIPVSFGKAGNVLTNGVHWTTPWFTSTKEYDLTLNIVGETQVELRTKDAQKFTVNVIGHFCITDNCISDPNSTEDPTKDIEARKREIVALYNTLGKSDYKEVFKNFLLQAANAAAGKRSISDIPNELDAFSQEIYMALQAKLQERGYGKFLKLKEVLVNGYNMAPEAEAFSNNVAAERQKSTKIALQQQNQVKLNELATAQGQEESNRQRAAFTGFHDNVKELIELGVSPEVAATALKWQGDSVIAPGSGGNVSVLVQAPKRTGETDQTLRRQPAAAGHTAK